MAVVTAPRLSHPRLSSFCACRLCFYWTRSWTFIQLRPDDSFNLSLHPVAPHRQSRCRPSIPFCLCSFYLYLVISQSSRHVEPAAVSASPGHGCSSRAVILPSGPNLVLGLGEQGRRLHHCRCRRRRHRRRCRLLPKRLGMFHNLPSSFFGAPQHNAELSHPHLLLGTVTDLYRIIGLQRRLGPEAQQKGEAEAKGGRAQSCRNEGDNHSRPASGCVRPERIRSARSRRGLGPEPDP